MTKYAYHVYHPILDVDDSFRLSVNIAGLSVLFTFAGGLLSYLLYYMFDVYNDTDPHGKDWEKKSIHFKVFDVVVEIGIIGMTAFWFSYFINTFAPIIPVDQRAVGFVDTYATGLFFMFTIFLFLEDFGNKLKHLYDIVFGGYFDFILPAEGSILDFSLRYSLEQRKKHHQYFGSKSNA